MTSTARGMCLKYGIADARVYIVPLGETRRVSVIEYEQYYYTHTRKRCISKLSSECILILPRRRVVHRTPSL